MQPGACRLTQLLLHDLVVLALPSLASLSSVLHPLVRQKLLNGPPLCRVLVEALIDKVRKLAAPLVRDTLDRFVDNCIEQLLLAHHWRPVLERRSSCRQLKREAAERPDVDLLRVGVALCDLWSNPARCTSLSPAVLLLLAQEDAEAEVCDLDASIRAAKDVVRFYVAVEHVVSVHLLQSKRDLVQAVLTELLSEVAILLKDDFGHVAAFHELKEHPNAVLVVKDLLTLDQLV